MSSREVYRATDKIGDEWLNLSVFGDSSALFSSVVHGTIECMRALDPDEDGSDIAITGPVREWFERELATGRAKAGAS